MKELHKEQLYPEQAFIDFCLYDEFRKRKIDEEIKKGFLDACEKDKLILPLLVQKQNIKDKDGNDQEVDVRYYSPFQIFSVVGLARNSIDENGNLRDTSVDWVYQKDHKTRFISWRGGAFNADSYKRKKDEGEEENDPMVNHFTEAEDFHNFLRLLHGLGEEKDYAYIDRDRSRLFTRTPSLQYNLKPIQEVGIKYLNDYQLDITKLKRLLKSVGRMATDIDPLEYWYSYIKRHPQWRKDKFKGLAVLTQELYGLCDIFYEIIELVSNDKLPPLPDYIYGDMRPYMMDKAEYASGRDIKTLKSANAKLKEWVKSKKTLLTELAPNSEEGRIILANIEVGLDKSEKLLVEYENLYGDKRYVGSTHFIYPEEKLKLDDLDKETRKWVDMVMVQRDGFKEKDRDRDLEVKREITHAIEHRLDELARLVSDPAFQLANAFWPLHYKIKHEKEMSEPKLWMDFDKNTDRNSPDYEKKRVQFWSKDMKVLQKPYDDKLKEIDDAQTGLHRIGRETMLVFCADCRQRFVLLHHGYNDQQVSSEAVCDYCFNGVSQGALEASPEDWKKIKYGEWKCDCGQKTLYKFALGNVMSVKAYGEVPIKAELVYGRLNLEAKCPKCNEISTKSIDWGWQE